MRPKSRKTLSLLVTVWMVIASTLLLWPVQAAESVTAGQERAAAEYLAAVAAGDTQAVAFAIHPTELDRLRIMIVQKLREEAARGESAMRIRLFGDGMPMGEIERSTSVNLFRSLARKLSVRSRFYEKLEGLIAVRDNNQLHVIVKGKPPRDRGRLEVIELVTLLPYGKEWKAAVAPELEAQIDDLLNGRTRDTTTPSTGPTAVERAAPVATGRNTPEILALLEQAEKALVDGKCDRYYRDYLSPELRRSLSSRTLDSLVSGCNRSIASRELLIAALRIVRRTAPALEREGNRAVYDVEGQGLPFDRYVLERIDGRWYIAE
ncbi:MAG: hypothetical protein FJ160_00080 [Gammaproteobacteria bacterium]|nr:hypothetical protein [Gammaproteobacteria bacterium]